MTLHLFEGYGIELELIIADSHSLLPRPIADLLLSELSGQEPAPAEFALGPITACNELTRHLIELKTSGPAPSLRGLSAAFHETIAALDARLKAHGAGLLPGALHSRFDPAEAQLWPYDQGEVYEAFDRIFDCRGHGWANLQSVQLNLPFATDDELRDLHAVLRLLLPLLPGVSAASPYVEGRATGLASNRLRSYRDNCARIPEITGAVVPEPISSAAQYQADILEPMYRAIAPQDPEGVLQEEWLNARGVIARFDRMALEVRTIDAQECAAANIAICAAVSAAAQGLIERGLSAQAQAVPTATLAAAHELAVREGDAALISDPSVLRALGLSDAPRRPAQVWRELLALTPPAFDPEVEAAWEVILEEGCLASRMRLIAGPKPSAERLRELDVQLAEALLANRSLRPEALS